MIKDLNGSIVGGKNNNNTPVQFTFKTVHKEEEQRNIGSITNKREGSRPTLHQYSGHLAGNPH